MKLAQILALSEHMISKTVQTVLDREVDETAVHERLVAKVMHCRQSDFEKLRAVLERMSSDAV